MMTELHYHILLTLTCLAPVFIVCIFALYLRQYALWEKCCKLEKDLQILKKDLLTINHPVTRNILPFKVIKNDNI